MDLEVILFLMNYSLRRILHCNSKKKNQGATGIRLFICNSKRF